MQGVRFGLRAGRGSSGIARTSGLTLRAEPGNGFLRRTIASKVRSLSELLRAAFLTTTIALTLSASAHAEIIQRTGGGYNPNNDFHGRGIVDTLLVAGPAQYGERFEGQTGPSGRFWDQLSGQPSGPLILLPGEPSQNLHLKGYGAITTLAGCSSIGGGCPFGTAEGEGAISILLDRDASRFAIRIFGATEGSARFEFFAVDGSILGSHRLDFVLRNSTYTFRATEGERIRGISITNMDPGGISFSNPSFTFLSEPRGLTLAGLAALLALFRAHRES